MRFRNNSGNDKVREFLGSFKMNSIELKNVTKRLKGNTVLDDITFTFES